MTPRRGRGLRRLRSVALAALLGVGASALGAQDAPRPSLDRRVDLFADRHQVSGGFGDWEGVGVRLSVPAGVRDTWFAEALYRRAFGDAGTYLSVANQHVWTERWYSSKTPGSAWRKP